MLKQREALSAKANKEKLRENGRNVNPMSEH